MRNNRAACLLCIVSLISIPATAIGSTLYGSNRFSEPIFTVDQTTSARTYFPSATGLGYHDLASDWRPESQRIWGLPTDGQPRLTRLNPTTGAPTDIGALANDIRSIAYDVTTDTLFGTSRTGLYKIDPDTANTTFVGVAGLPNDYPDNGLGSDLAGNLFAYPFLSTSASLIRIDKLTGAFQSIGPTTGPAIILEDLAARPEDGVMFGIAGLFGDGKLYEVNTTTGALTPIGDRPQPPIGLTSGLAFSPAVPEPSTLLLAAVGLPLVLRRRRSHGALQ